MAIITTNKPSLRDFVQKYATMFEEKVVLPCLTYQGVISQVTPLEHHVTMRKGAPVLQMLQAPENFVQGSAEPWIVDVVCALLKASDQHVVLEGGSFIGATTQRLAETLVEMGGGSLVAVELEAERAATAQARLETAKLPPTVDWKIVHDNILTYLKSIPDESVGFAWIDDNHEQAHVYEELSLLLPKMVSGGIVTGHDVWGSCALHEVFARFPRSLSLELPRLGPAGGIGIIQV